MLPASSDSSETSYSSDLWRLALFVAALFFALLGQGALRNPDEGRYTEIPREMAVSGDYVTPRLNGVKYFEKPPLLYWLTAATIKVGGANEVTARLWPALFGVLGVLATYAAARALYDRPTGIASAVVLATTFFYYGLSRIALLDGVVSVLIATALFAFIVAVRLPRGSARRGWFYAFYAAMALAILAKGLIGLVLPCGIIGLWVLLLNRWKQLWPFYPLAGTVIVLAIAAPWHVAAARANHDFLQFYFIHEHFERFTSRVHDRYEPWWYFVPVLLGGLFPWVTFFFQSTQRSMAGWWRTRGENQVAWFLFIWIAFVFLFFSKSQSKLPPYILPLFPAAAVWIGRYLAEAWMDPEKRSLRGGLFVFSALAVLLGGALPFVKVARDELMRADLRPWQWLIGGAFVLTGIVVAIFAAQRKTRSALIAIVVGTVFVFGALNPAAARADKRSCRQLARVIKLEWRPGDRVYSYGYYFQDVPVYLGQEIGVVDFLGELEFGVHAEPEKTADRFISKDEFLRRWREAPRCFVVARKGDYAALTARPDFQAKVLSEYRDQILFSNR